MGILITLVLILITTMQKTGKEVLSRGMGGLLIFNTKFAKHFTWLEAILYLVQRFETSVINKVDVREHAVSSEHKIIRFEILMKVGARGRNTKGKLTLREYEIPTGILTRSL